MKIENLKMHYDENNEFGWVALSDICKAIGFKKDKCQNEIRNAYANPWIPIKKMKIEKENKNGVFQNREVYCIHKEGLKSWLTDLNKKAMTKGQLKNLSEILGCLEGNEMDLCLFNSGIFSYETELQRELYSIGKFMDINITNSECKYSFGRTDLEGIDSNGNRCCIELKKYKSFSNTKEQLLRYKNSGLFDRVLYCAYYISPEFLAWAKENNIECCIYRTEIKVYSCDEVDEEIVFGT